MAFEYVSGVRNLVLIPLDKDSADTVRGLAVTESGATSGYVKEVDNTAEAVIGICFSEVVVTGAADGDHSVVVDISSDSIYRVGPDSGSVTQAMANKSMDVGANGLTADINGSTTDDLFVARVDVTNNKLYVQLKRTLAGV